jgi:hypothetical protein
VSILDLNLSYNKIYDVQTSSVNFFCLWWMETEKGAGPFFQCGKGARGLDRPRADKGVAACYQNEIVADPGRD